jgi:hypothetical protein
MRLRSSSSAKPHNERIFVLEKLGVGQQVPKPPAPKPGVPPGDLPPVPDPAPPPIENPGDAPLPPITDPDVIEPGEPNPARTPMRVRGAKRSPESFAASYPRLKPARSPEMSGATYSQVQS